MWRMTVEGRFILKGLIGGVVFVHVHLTPSSDVRLLSLMGAAWLLFHSIFHYLSDSRTDVQPHLCRHHVNIQHPQWGQQAAAVAGPQLQTGLTMVSPTMKALVDALWAVWSIGASIYDYIHTSAMEERIHALENVITIHQCVIGLLSAGVLVLFTYILLKKL